MAAIDLALAKLDGVRKIQNGYQARCPCHDDKHQSLSLRDVDGKLLLYCHAGCEFNAIMKWLNLPPREENGNPIITAIYDYTDEGGKLLYQVVRYHPKSFKQRRPVENGWEWNLNGIEPVLYHLPDIIEGILKKRDIFVVEGEKDADNLRAVGQIATTISGGASAKWPPAIVPLFDTANVVIIPDNDEPGRKYAAYVANLLYGFASSLKLITLPAKDVSDYLDSHTIDDLFKIIYNTNQYTPSGAVTREEFNAWRGVNQYLLKMLKVERAKYQRRYTSYN